MALLQRQDFTVFLLATIIISATDMLLGPRIRTGYSYKWRRTVLQLMSNIAETTETLSTTRTRNDEQAPNLLQVFFASTKMSVTDVILVPRIRSCDSGVLAGPFAILLAAGAVVIMRCAVAPTARLSGVHCRYRQYVGTRYIAGFDGGLRLFFEWEHCCIPSTPSIPTACLP